MNRRPAHEPSRQFRQPQRLWDDATRHAPSLGCSNCLDRDRCGGVHTDAGILDCRDLCTCCQAPSWNENMNCFSDLAINSENISRPSSHY
jgi:hypothetical protein